MSPEYKGQRKLIKESENKITLLLYWKKKKNCGYTFNTTGVRNSILERILYRTKFIYWGKYRKIALSYCLVLWQRYFVAVGFSNSILPLFPFIYLFERKGTPFILSGLYRTNGIPFKYLQYFRRFLAVNTLSLIWIQPFSTLIFLNRKLNLLGKVPTLSYMWGLKIVPLSAKSPCI